MEEIRERKKSEYRSSRRSKTLIKTALLKLMHEKKFEDITVTDIVRVADINRGTFYAHYSNVQDVITKMQEEMMVTLVSSFGRFPADEVLSNPRPILDAIATFLVKDKGYYKLLFSLPGIYDYISKNKNVLIGYFLSSSVAHAMISLGKRNEMIALIDFWISAILNLYIDIVLERVPMRLDEAPVFIMKLVSLNPSWLELMTSEAAEESEKTE